MPTFFFFANRVAILENWQNMDEEEKSIYNPKITTVNILVLSPFLLYICTQVCISNKRSRLKSHLKVQVKLHNNTRDLRHYFDALEFEFLDSS